MGAVSAVDDGLKRFYKYKPGREVEKFVQAKRYNNIRLKREVEKFVQAKRFNKHRLKREVEKFVQAKRFNNIRLQREVEDLAKILISVNFAPKKLISNDENKERFGKWGIFTISH